MKHEKSDLYQVLYIVRNSANFHSNWNVKGNVNICNIFWYIRIIYTICTSLRPVICVLLQINNKNFILVPFAFSCKVKKSHTFGFANMLRGQR